MTVSLEAFDTYYNNVDTQLKWVTANIHFQRDFKEINILPIYLRIMDV